MTAALGWGALAASSLVIGALLGLTRQWPPRPPGLVLAFGAGALISAVSFDLAPEGAQVGDPGFLALGLAVGAITYFALNRIVGRRSRSANARGADENARRRRAGQGRARYLYVDGDKVGEGRVEATVPMISSADETCDVVDDSGTPVSEDYTSADATFNGKVKWVQLDAALDDTTT